MLLEPQIKYTCNGAVQAFGQPARVVHEPAAPVRRIDGGQGRYHGCRSQPGYGIAGIQAALGVGNDIHLFTSRLPAYLLYFAPNNHIGAKSELLLVVL